MKKLLAFAAILFCGLCFSSCTKDDAGSNNGKLDGLWAETEWGYFDSYDDEFFVEDESDCVTYLIEFSSGICTDYETDGMPFKNGYLIGNSKDLEKGISIEYSYKNNSLWAMGIEVASVTFLSSDKIKLTYTSFVNEEDDGEYAIYERVKGFK